MKRLVRVEDKDNLSLAEVVSLLGNRSMNIKARGEFIMEFVDIHTGEVKKRRHVKNTRTWTINQLFTHQAVFHTLYVTISNDDGDWHPFKSVMRATYQSNGGDYFTDPPTFSRNELAFLYQYIGQFQAPPSGTTKTINAVGLSYTWDNQGVGNCRCAPYVIFATRLPGAGETQDDVTVLNITYKVTWTA